MYRFNIWKIVLIIGVLLLSLLYLMPTPDSLYLPLYGNLPLWIQEDLPHFEVPDNAIKVNLADVDYPEGKNLQEAIDELQDVFNVHLKNMGFEENVDYEFGSTEEKEFFVRLISDKAKENLTETLENLQIQEDIPPFEVTEDNAFKVNLADVDYPEGKNLQEAIDELQDVFNVHLKNMGFEENVDYEFDSTEEKEFFVRLISDKAKENPTETLENLHLYGSIPITLRRILPANRLKLGLDLKGGVHLVLEVDLEKSKAALLRDNAYAIPETLKAEQVICRQAELVSGENALDVLVEIPSRLKSEKDEKAAYLKKAVELLNDVDFFEDAELVTEKESASMYRLSLTDKGMQEYSDEAIQQVLIVLRNRVDAFGVAEPNIRQEANRPRIIIELPGAKDSSEPLRIVQTMGRLEFKMAKKSPTGGSLWTGSANTPPPSEEELGDNEEIRYHHETGAWYVLESPVLLTGHNIEDSRPQTGANFNIVVSMTMDSEGSSKFAKITGDHIGEHLAILLDDKVQSAPVIRDQLRKHAQIEGNFTSEEANYLSNILNAGAFPVGVQVGEERTVGPTLGQESIDNGIKAAVIGMAFILVFMIIYYRLSGIIAIIALIFNMVIIISALAGFGAALTLPGIAGLVLTIGMAVDANVLIFERIREELRSGKAVWAAITSGYQRAFITILDANLTTFFTALVLYHFGKGPIRGFAVTLGIGIMASMFTAIVVTREIYGLVIGNRDVQKLSI